MRHLILFTFTAFFGFSVWVAPAHSWWGNGHAILTTAATNALPQVIPSFFRAGELVPAHTVYDADLFKNWSTPHLRAAEHPEHYYDPELIGDVQLPATRYEFIQACVRAGVEPQKVGFLPYAVVEWTERLAIALAEHRKWPDDPTIKSKCLVYAGLLAHYAQDLIQPLHVTVHFDGKIQADGPRLHQGIHEKVDALIEKANFTIDELTAGVAVAAVDSLMPAIRSQVERSRGLIDRTYALHDNMGDLSSADVRKFARERARAAVGFTSSLFLTAWTESASIELPGWHDRSP